MKNNKIKPILSLLISTLITTVFFSCNNSESNKTINNDGSFHFEKNSRVVFVGNSITHGGMFHNNIFLYHVTRFPQKNIYAFNCGVSGDVTWGVLDRMEEDILINKPTHAVIMLGMNDVQRNLYATTITTNADTLSRRKEAVDYYKTNLEKIINIFLSKNIKVILETPSIYDQTAKLPEPNHLGVNDVLGECAVYIDSLAVKYKLPTVDYYSIMNRINSEIQKSNPSVTLTTTDRIHPQATGHFVMSYQFLKSEKVPKYVAEIRINAKKEKSSDCNNCTIIEQSEQENGVAFSVKENALPFPVTDDQNEGLQLVPFEEDFNVQLLQVKSLSEKTQYQLKIDDEIIGSFTGKQFNEGINLTEYHNTPQYKQSEKVLAVLQELWQIEGKLRGMKFIEYLPFYKEIKDKHNFKEVETFMDSAFIAQNYDDPYYKSELNKFLANKPLEEEYKNQCDLLREKAYKLAQPVAHRFTIEAK